MRHQFLAVVDDDTYLVEELCDWLRDIGYASQGFEHGRDFLDNFHPATSGVVLGINMPVMNGWEAIAEMRERKIVMPVLTMSAYLSGLQTRDLLEQSEFHLAKPFTRELFLHVVTRVMDPDAPRLPKGWAWGNGQQYPAGIHIPIPDSERGPAGPLWYGWDA